MRLLVIRHGQSQADVLHVIEGRADFSLTETGRRQAARMAAWVSARFAVDRLVASPLKRAAQTAQHLGEASGRPVLLDDDLMEWQNGLLAGLTRAEADEKYPMPAHKHPHTALYGTESVIQFRSRAETALSRLLYESKGAETVAVVSHGGLINQLFRSFLRLPLETDVTLATGDTGVHCWIVSERGRRVQFANSLAHLEEETADRPVKAP